MNAAYRVQDRVISLILKHEHMDNDGVKQSATFLWMAEAFHTIKSNLNTGDF